MARDLPRNAKCNLLNVFDRIRHIKTQGSSPFIEDVLGNRAAGAAGQILLAIAAVFAICYAAKLVMITVLTSILLAFVLAPLVDALRQWRIPRSVGALLAVALLLACAYGVMYFSYNQARSFIRDLPKYSQDWLTNSASSLTELLVFASFIPFLVYFMLSWMEQMRGATVNLFRPENRDAVNRMLGGIASMFRGFVAGNFICGLVMGIVSVVAFGILGLPYFYFLGIISAFLSLIPNLGVVLAMLPPLAAGVGTLDGPKLLWIVVITIALHMFAINVFFPKIIGRRLNLNPLVVTIALLAWGWLWGVMGLILAVPITGALKIVFDHVDSLQRFGAWMGE
jgi:predicted PurR-regulated permease PerM